jgi:hypothetical protein
MIKIHLGLPVVGVVAAVVEVDSHQLPPIHPPIMDLMECLVIKILVEVEEHPPELMPISHH